jgi:hypothetical protein
MSQNNKELLTRFEMLIFSNIVPEGAQIPAVHDGAEELGKLFASLRKGQ